MYICMYNGYIYIDHNGIWVGYDQWMVSILVEYDQSLAFNGIFIIIE